MKNRDLYETAWTPQRYLDQFFPSDGVESEANLQFLSQYIPRVKGFPRAIDVGCGPTVIYWMPVVPYVESLDAADYMKESMEEARIWLMGERDAHDWRSHIRLLLQYEGAAQVTEDLVAEREALTRAVVRYLLHCNVRRSNPITNNHRGQYGLVTSFFCADSITDNVIDWGEYMRNIFSLLAPGGHFFGSALHNTEQIALGETLFSNAKINKDDVFRLLTSAGFKKGSIQIEVLQDGLPRETRKRERAVAAQTVGEIISFCGQIGCL